MGKDSVHKYRIRKERGKKKVKNIYMKHVWKVVHSMQGNL